jgi:hypothetical protein
MARAEMMPKFLEKIAALLHRPPANSGEPSLDKKRKRLGELFSSRTSTPKDAPGSLLLPRPLILRFLMLWTHEFRYLFIFRLLYP